MPPSVFRDRCESGEDYLYPQGLLFIRRASEVGGEGASVSCLTEREGVDASLRN